MMFYTLNLYSTETNEIDKFFTLFYENQNQIYDWNYSVHTNSSSEKKYIYLYTKRTTNPIEFVVLLGALIDNDNKYNISVWLSLDNGTFINITSNNLDLIIKYIYERFPY